MTARTTRVASLAAGLLLLAACDVPPPPPPVRPPPSAPGPTAATCPDGFEISGDQVEAASGLRAFGITLRNCGDRPYHVDGFPVITMLDEYGRPIGITVGTGSEPVSSPDVWDRPPEPIDVAPGETVRARVLWRNTVTDGESITGAHLTVAPAKGAAAQLVTPNGGIDVGTTHRLAVNAWTKVDR
ncbi:uncharacterized protein DUF4232 [Asanoa ferruginea]|uniref:Uncharacterized protein DUF4232 n=1 Tax=Asanoa ferruginea TaxID=53367 RepID=A0A3D9ZUY1_9ACTN|nr:DUF4232 domain-containing protein [Asanoa ferruginea]REG00435.1 uncharacterized protein DUF4232 [Asanoa ferruginea]GIF50990.1 hypothetical protein Afe04nite_55290 [Asanoa ferruginea]